MSIKSEPGELSKEPNVLRRLLRSRSGTTGLIIISAYVIISLLGALEITPYPPTEQHRIDRLQAPNSTYYLGTDMFGRDMFSRLIKGATNSLYVAFFSVAISSTLGTLIGTTSAYVGGRFDNIMMRVMDIFFAFPAILLALLVVVILGRGLDKTIIAIAVVYTPIFARVARGPVLSVKEMDFITSARCVGMRDHRIISRHILPNTLAPLIVQISLALSWSLLTEAGLSFLGLGLPPPTPDWGFDLSAGKRFVPSGYWWIITYPGMMIALLTLGFSMLGEGLNEILNPRLTEN